MLQRLRAFGRHAAKVAVPQLPPDQFLVDELSAHHVAGWLSAAGDNTVEAVLPATGEILARGRADQYKFRRIHAGLGHHGFHLRLSRELSQAEQTQLAVRRVVDGAHPDMQVVSTEYSPVMLVAMDIVDNCNLRCPFCLYDYSNTSATHVMDEATIDAAIRFIPYTFDSNFWFSCLHEPALHPQFKSFLARVPEGLRRKVFFTTNLAKRMPPDYYGFLADSGLGVINISIESQNAEIYEKMRKGARHRIFLEGLNALTSAFATGAAPPLLRYIVMVYRSNLREIPSLVRYLIEEQRADKVQLRFTFDLAHIPATFRAAEFIDEADWDWLEAELARDPRPQVQLIRPPRENLPSTGVVLPGRFEFKLSYDGTLNVHRFWPVPFDSNGEPPVATVNIRDITDPLHFLDSLTGAPK